MDKRESAGRLYLLDGIRGITLVNMVLFHGMYDLVYMFGFSSQWFIKEPGYIWQQAICWIFIFLSGMCWSFSRNNLKRGLVTFGLGMVMTIVSALVMPEFTIKFGILHFMGAAMIILYFVEPLLKKILPQYGFLLAAGAFFLFRDVNRGYLGFEGLHIAKLPSALFDTSYLFPLGFPAASFSSGDYFSIFPWIFLYLSGYFFFEIVSKYENIMKAMHVRVPIFGLIGRKTIWIYMLHQPVIMGMLYIILKI